MCETQPLKSRVPVLLPLATHPMPLSSLLSEKEFCTSVLGFFACCAVLGWLLQANAAEGDGHRQYWYNLDRAVQRSAGIHIWRDLRPFTHWQQRWSQHNFSVSQFPHSSAEAIGCSLLCCWRNILNKWAKNLNRTRDSCREHGAVGIEGSASFLMRQSTLKCYKNKEQESSEFSSSCSFPNSSPSFPKSAFKNET